MELDTVAKVLQAFYRLVGTLSDDEALTEGGEATNDVAYLFLTRGCRQAQKWMLKMGFEGWRQRSAALSWSGSDATTGGVYADLPSDFLRAYGVADRLSPIVQANGDRWGALISGEDREAKGDLVYIEWPYVWLARTASPPTTAYLDYHYKHPAWSGDLADGDIDFPMDSRWLIPAEAANVAKEENWITGGADTERRIERALIRARDEARGDARTTKGPRQMRRLIRFGNHW